MIRFALLLMLVVAGCNNAPKADPPNLVPKFSFGQRVVITEGFYKGATGQIVEADDSIYRYGPERREDRRMFYRIEGTKFETREGGQREFIGNLPSSTWIEESQLEALPDAEGEPETC
jgi:hypothetical protein